MRRSMLTSGEVFVDVGMEDWANAGAVGGGNVQLAFSTYRPAQASGFLKRVGAEWFGGNGNTSAIFVGTWTSPNFVVRSVSESYTLLTNNYYVLSTPLAINAGDYIGSWIAIAKPPDYTTGGIYAEGSRFQKNVSSKPTAGETITSWSNIGSGVHGFYGTSLI